MYEGSLFSTPSPQFILFRLFDDWLLCLDESVGAIGRSLEGAIDIFLARDDGGSGQEDRGGGDEKWSDSG